MILRFLRKRLGVLTQLWLCCQALSLSALAPLNCCPAHSDSWPATGGHESELDCHHESAHQRHQGHQGHPVSVDGQPGSTEASHHHTGAAHGARVGEGPQNTNCVMQGTCSSPARALASLIWVPGVLNDPTSQPAADAVSLAQVTDASTLDLFLDLTLPPPRG